MENVIKISTIFHTRSDKFDSGRVEPREQKQNKSVASSFSSAGFEVNRVTSRGLHKGKMMTEEGDDESPGNIRYRWVMTDESQFSSVSLANRERNFSNVLDLFLFWEMSIISAKLIIELLEK